jgi:hypothetical protein
MKRIAFAVSVVVLVFGVAVQAQTQAQPKMGSVEQEIIKLENEAGVAMVKGDVAFFERVVSEDYTWTDPDGNIWTKADFLASMKSGEDVVSSWNIDDYKVRVYGDAAVCLARVTSKEQYKGKDVSGQTRWTDTLIKRDGRWQFVASHSSRIAQK